MNPWRALDRFLNNITMYKLVLWGLRILAVLAVGLALTKHLSLSAVGLTVSFLTLATVCFVSNWLLGRFWPAVRNRESYIVTALILGFILPPPATVSNWLFIIAAGVIAMASKYLLAPYRKHIFNPAAFAAVVLGLGNWWPASWWIGTPIMLPFTAILGFLLIRKLHRGGLFASFLLFSLVTTVVVSLLQHAGVPDALHTAIASSPLIFLGTVMLTEPFTMPPRLRQQLIYGALVGVVFSAQLHSGRFSTTPEVALILGNLFAYAVSPKYRLLLRFKSKTQLAKDTYDLAFESDRPLAFEPGQYLEWTLPNVEWDSRGNRRSFSIASSPEDTDLHIGTKATPPLRGFKKALFALEPGDTVVAGQLTGNFILPPDPAQKLVFVAGGIGITPFISMLSHLIRTKQQRDIVLFYMVASADEMVYKGVLSAAAKYGVSVVPVISPGRLTHELLEKHVPDYAERRFYLSGPNALVDNYRRLLRGLGMSRRAILSDYFSGY